VSCHVLGVVGKFSMNKDVSSWFHNVSTYNEKVIENNFFIENSFKLKNYNGIWAHSWLENFQFIGFNEGIWICKSTMAFVKNIEC